MQAVILLNLTFIFSGPHKKFYLVLLHMTIVTSIPLEKCKQKMQCALNYSGTRFLSIKLLNFLMDSVLMQPIRQIYIL